MTIRERLNNTRPLTKRIAGLAVLGWGLLQTEPVMDWLKATFQHHPHVMTLLGLLTTIISLLHQPAVQKALGLETTTIVQTSQVVPLQPPARPVKESI